MPRDLVTHWSVSDEIEIFEVPNSNVRVGYRPHQRYLVGANDWKNLRIRQRLYVTQQQLGVRVSPGNYLYDPQSGCWMELNTGQSGCPGSAGGGNPGGGSYISRYGSGESNANGDWNHWSNAAGGAVGGTGDGCIYTSFGWSNC